MIHNEELADDQKLSINYSALTKEESFFLELFKKREDPQINIRYTSEGILTSNLESFLDYYDEQEIIGLLEKLVSKNIIEKREKGGILLCPHCGNHTSMLILSCPRCGSTRVGLKEMLLHEECGYLGASDEFVNGISLCCPNCKKTLNDKSSEGVKDVYTITDSYFICNNCKTKISKKNYNMICVKCNLKFETIEASYMFSTSYNMSSDNYESHKESTTLIKDLKTKSSKTIEYSISKKETKKNRAEKGDDIIKEKKVIKETFPKNQTDVLIKSQKKEPKHSFKDKIIEAHKSEKKTIPSYRWWVKSNSKDTIIDSNTSTYDENKRDTSDTIIEDENIESSFEIIKSENFLKEEISKEITDNYFGKQHKILFILENNTIRELIIETLEKINKPIKVVYVEDIITTLDEIEKEYDAIIMDLDLEIEGKKILSIIEKSNILAPIIGISHNDLNRENKNIRAILKKKQQDYKKIIYLLEDLFQLNYRK